jgi:hypothetical protein
MSRLWQTIDHRGNAPHCTVCLGNLPGDGRSVMGRRRRRVRVAVRPNAPTKLLIVDVVAEHDKETHEELAGEGDFGFGPSASMQEAVGPDIVQEGTAESGFALTLALHEDHGFSLAR